MKFLRRGLGFERFSGLYLWAVLIIIFSVWQSAYFPTTATVHSLAAERSISAVLALAIIIPLACGAFDLSVGAVANFSTIVSALLINDHWSWPFAALLAVLVSAAIGTVNGLFVVKLHVSSFITTLGIASVITALQVILTNNLQPTTPNVPSWSNFTQQTIFGFQVVFLYMLVIALVVGSRVQVHRLDACERGDHNVWRRPREGGERQRLPVRGRGLGRERRGPEEDSGLVRGRCGRMTSRRSSHLLSPQDVCCHDRR